LAVKEEYNINGFIKKALKATVTVDLSIKCANIKHSVPEKNF